MLLQRQNAKNPYVMGKILMSVLQTLTAQSWPKAQLVKFRIEAFACKASRHLAVFDLPHFALQSIAVVCMEMQQNERI
jgi:hypothetical protein